MKNTLLTFMGFHDPYTKGLVGQEEQPRPVLSLVSLETWGEAAKMLRSRKHGGEEKGQESD